MKTSTAASEKEHGEVRQRPLSSKFHIFRSFLGPPLLKSYGNKSRKQRVSKISCNKVILYGSYDLFFVEEPNQFGRVGGKSGSSVKIGTVFTLTCYVHCVFLFKIKKNINKRPGLTIDNFLVVCVSLDLLKYL